MRTCMRWFLVMTVCFAGVVLTACAGPITLKDNGRTIECALDSELQIELEGNMTTGYSWELLKYNASVTEPLGKPEYTTEQDDKRMGAGGTFVFKMKVVAAGESNIEIVYRRPWEKDKAPEQVFTLKVLAGTMGVIESD